MDLRYQSCKYTFEGKGYTFSVLQNKFEIVDGQPATRVFTLSHPGLKQNHVFCAEADDPAVKWTKALEEAIKLQDKPSHD